MEDAGRFTAHCRQYCDLLNSAKESSYMEKILASSGDVKVLFFVTDKLPHRNMELTNRFEQYFIN